MEWFYDAQIRRYITQTIRAMSNFVVKYGDGTLHRIPVMYGDPDRAVASIIRNNSENKVNSIPRISVYVSSLSLDRDRTADQTFVGKVHVRERGVFVNPMTGVETYNQAEGKNYTVERLMPTPFSLKMKIDIWSSNTDQKLQILEQILVLFNPSLELQTTDNYIDWTSLSVLNLEDIAWDSRTVPIGNDSGNSIATLTVQAPIWVSPPVKVKHLGVITKIITSMYANSSSSGTYIEGLGAVDDPMASTTTLTDLLSQTVTTISDYQIQVYNNQARLLGANESVIPMEPALDISVKQGPGISWLEVFSQYPGEYIAGSSQIYLIQSDGTYVVGTIALNPLDYTILQINWNPDTVTSNTGIDSQGNIEFQSPAYMNSPTQYRTNSPGTFDAIVNPLTYNPYRPTGNETSDRTIPLGLRFLIIEDIGNASNLSPAVAWGNLVAVANDIIEWSGTEWNVIFNSAQETTTMVWQTNIYTGVQYLWDSVQWKKSFEGEYTKGQWKIIL
jgi:hypothetical protein